MNTHQTTRELKEARDYYREKRIPEEARAIMDAETQRLMEENIASLALKVSDSAPDFILPDGSGKPVRLYSLLQNGPVVVVFYRGGWCPYCNIHLRGFQRVLNQIKELGAQLLAISPQLPDNSLSTQEKDELEYPVLSDVGNQVAHQFGIAFRLSDALVKLYEDFEHPLQVSNGAEGAFELPMPATFLIDSKGIIRLAHVEADYTQRSDPDDLLREIQQLKN